MRFKLDGITYSLKFQHSLPIKEEVLEDKVDASPHTSSGVVGYTEVILSEVVNAGSKHQVFNELDRMKAFCAPEDKYVKAIGRKVALTKMIRREVVSWMADKDLRKRFWMIYFSKTSDLSDEAYVRYFGCPKASYMHNGVTVEGE